MAQFFGNYSDGPGASSLPPTWDTKSGYLNIDRGLYGMSKLVGIPAGRESYRAAIEAGHGGGTAAWMGMKAGGRQMSQPVYWGLMETAGIMPSAYFSDAVPGFSWMGFGFEQERTLSEALREKKSPWKYKGHALGKKGAKWIGVKGAMKAAPVIGSVLGLVDTLHQTHKGWEEEGAAGAAKGFLKVAALTIGMNVAGRAVASVPALALLAGPVIAGMYVAGEVSQNMQAYNNRSLPLLAGDMSAFNTRSAYTMRQRSLQAIQRSHLNARSVLGNEAAYQHISSMRGM